jgi:hypothetical protein
LMRTVHDHEGAVREGNHAGHDTFRGLCTRAIRQL